MESEIKTWLVDILQAINEINDFLSPNKDFFDFKGDIKTKRAIERNIEIIGEAVNRIIKSNPNFSIANARKIIDTINRVSHGYDSVSEEIIWSILIRDLPMLKAEIEKLLTNSKR